MGPCFANRTFLFAAYMLICPFGSFVNLSSSLATSSSLTKNSANDFWKTYPPRGPQPCTGCSLRAESTAGCDPTVQCCSREEFSSTRCGKMVDDSGDIGRSQKGVVGWEGSDLR